MRQTRRDFGRLMLAAWSGSRLGADWRPPGVTIGSASYSFRTLPLDGAIDAMRSLGLQHCVLWQGHVEPRPASRDSLRAWRTSVSMREIERVREKFERAGIRLIGFYYSLRNDFSDAEIQRGFEMAHALHVKYLMASPVVSSAKLLDSQARRHGIYIGLHNHANIAADEFARPSDFEKALEGATNLRINLDIGHLVAAGFDPVEFLQRHHARIVSLDVKDRKRNGDQVPFGEGDTPIAEVLRLLLRNRYKIPAMIEYEYKGSDPVVEVRKCMEYCLAALKNAKREQTKGGLI